MLGQSVYALTLQALGRASVDDAPPEEVPAAHADHGAVIEVRSGPLQADLASVVSTVVAAVAAAAAAIPVATAATAVTVAAPSAVVAAVAAIAIPAAVITVAIALPVSSVLAGFVSATCSAGKTSPGPSLPLHDFKLKDSSRFCSVLYLLPPSPQRPPPLPLSQFPIRKRFAEPARRAPHFTNFLHIPAHKAEVKREISCKVYSNGRGYTFWFSVKASLPLFRGQPL